ncbi:thioesterase family protein [Virgibacillus sp. 179-BFC.A HS]|uniref:Thioesterase family protein n=1 Tax=Tigheibacillus jepli TaxID=3035914 RepID=A0ABU5CD83_9BACI|nr:thioesterase family protein [Virgibacillus sp. 179-BFC.A HS]MDY0404299.1 thioesterase family protein [Virgibacillus sp. 179-BFC.A HS]
MAVIANDMNTEKLYNFFTYKQKRMMLHVIGGTKMAQLWHQEIRRVHYKDTDQMGVAHHANYVAWFEVGRTEWMRETGMAYSKMEDLGLLLPVVEMNAKYHKPARYDDRLVIFTKVTDISAVRIRFLYEVRKIGEEMSMSTASSVTEPYGELLTSGSTLHMWVNRKWRPARIDKAAPDIYALLKEIQESE